MPSYSLFCFAFFARQHFSRSSRFPVGLLQKKRISRRLVRLCGELAPWRFMHLPSGRTRDSSKGAMAAATQLEKASRIVRDGGVVIVPTETYYALAGDPFQVAAVQRIYKIKSRFGDKPLPLIASDMETVLSAIVDPGSCTRTLMESFWPGSLTILLKPLFRVRRWSEFLSVREDMPLEPDSSPDPVMLPPDRSPTHPTDVEPSPPAAGAHADRPRPTRSLVATPSRGVHPLITGPSGKIGVRVPPDCAARTLAMLAGGWITATSANLSGDQNPREISMIAAEVVRAVDMVIDLGPTPGGLPSTVVEPIGRSFRIVRTGAVPEDVIRKHFEQQL